MLNDHSKILKMFGNTKKAISVEYKEKLLAQIAHYEKRIEEELNKRHRQNFEDESMENITNPYKLNLQPSQYVLKRQEASLSDRASMTLELGMLTIMQSEVNVMVTPPEVRKPVPEDGVWYDIAAECKIDLVSFTITFYAHKPHRKFAPTRYRDVVVKLTKPAHEKELAHSILPKLHLPNLILQVLQSYASVFRSRRTTLFELAKKYEDKLKMEVMPEGGIRVNFLDLLQVDWMLENLWSPTVPFQHRMRFELEYMPKDYIQAIGKLYKQFKDPDLETADRTLMLSKIFDICLHAAGPARELQESVESDPETAGRLHERRTTIDQEPDVPNVEHFPKKKRSSSKENKTQNRKTSMAPPKTIPKRAKKSKDNQKGVSENRKSVKRAIESDSDNVIKKSRVEDSDNRAGLKGGRDGTQDRDKTRADALKTNVQNRDNDKDGPEPNAETEARTNNTQKKSGKVNPKNTKDSAIPDDAIRKRDGKTVKRKGSCNTEHVGNAKKAKDDGTSKGSSEVSSKGSMKGDTNDKIVKSKDKTENNVTSSKTDGENFANTAAKTTDDHKTLDENIENNVARSKGNDNIAYIQNGKPNGKNTNKSKDNVKEKMVSSKKSAETVSKASKKVASAKDEGSVASSKHGTKVTDHGDIVNSKEKNALNDVAVPKSKATNKDDGKDNGTKDKITTKKVNNAETASRTSSKTAALKEDDGKTKAASGNQKDNVDGGSKKIAKERNVGGAIDKTKATVKKQQTVNIVKSKEILNGVNNNRNDNRFPENGKEIVKATDKIIEKCKLAKEKAPESNKKPAEDVTNNEKAHMEEKTKATNPKSTESDLGKNKMTINKTKTTRAHNSDQNEVAAKKRKTEPDNKNKNNTENPKTINNIEKPKSITRPNATTVKENTIKKTQNVEKGQNMTTKNQKNMLNVTITKSKTMPISKLQMDKTKGDKLKTKIPMMKSKTTFSSLGNKLKNNLVGNSKGVEKTKIPQKSLPVFKKFAKKTPTRVSPKLKMNMDKTKIMSNVHVVPTPVIIGGSALEVVDDYVYLGQTVQLGNLHKTAKKFKCM